MISIYSKNPIEDIHPRDIIIILRQYKFKGIGSKDEIGHEEKKSF